MAKEKKSRYPAFLEHLRDHPAGGSAVRVAAAIGVDRKSIYRYRDQARLYGITVDDTPGIFRLRSEDRRYLYEQVTLSRLEAHVLLSKLGPASAYSPSLRAVIDKLLASQGRRGKRDLVSAPPIHLPQQDDLPDGLYDDVIQAILENVTLELSYRNSRGEERAYRFDPYLLVPRDDHLYLVGANHNSREAGFSPLQTLRLDAVTGWTLTTGHFSKPQEEVQAYLERRFGIFAGEDAPVTVRLRVSPERANAVGRTRRHKSQRCTLQDDGSLIYELSVPLSPDLVYWVAGYGGHMRVLEPEALREKVLEHAREVLEANS
ncbi:MAG: WYL domain-containing protein [Deinococcota bacterium]|nr:WYL domain-containing protein [Deinococcota bacterium]